MKFGDLKKESHFLKKATFSPLSFCCLKIFTFSDQRFNFLLIFISSSLVITQDTVSLKVGNAMETTIVLTTAMKKIAHPLPVLGPNSNVPIWSSVFTNLTSVTELTIATTVLMNWVVLVWRQISAQTNNSNARVRKFASHKAGKYIECILRHR